MNMPALSRTARVLPALLLAVLLAACAGTGPRHDVTDPDAPRALPEASGVTVSWNDPATFTELRHSGNRWEARRGDWVTGFARHLQASVARALPAGERAHVTITDIRRAGDYEPGHGPQLDDVRIMRDIHWPRITLQLRRTAADGRDLGTSEHVLSDPGYLDSGVRSPRANEALYYENRLVDEWVRREFRSR